MPSIEYELDTTTTHTGADLTVAIITFNRPQAHNSFDLATIRELRDALVLAGSDPRVRGLLLTGKGKAFCTGADVKELHRVATCIPGGTDEEKGSDVAQEQVTEKKASAPAAGGCRIAHHIGLLTRYQHACIIEMRRMGKPVIVAVNGVVAGGGLPIALAGDYRLAADTARFKGSYFGVGVVPDGGITHSLPRLVGLTKAQELLLLDRTVDADEGLALGLVHSLHPVDELYLKALEVARELAKRPAWALGRLKLLLNQTFDTSIENQLEWERRYNMEPGTGPGLAEGVAAFIEKREPDFVGAEQTKE